MGSVKEQARSCGLWVVVKWALVQVVVVVVVAGAGSVVAARQIGQPELITQVTEAKEERRGGLLVDDVHLIESLPGGPPVSFSMRCGYITVDEKAGRALFFWFVEADVSGDSASAPLTLWLNGGPGCSSVGGGMLSELGPFYPTPDGAHLQQNLYSWNKFSNLLFLESPAGVGFSYSNTTSDYVTGDKETAEDSYNFLVQFFQLYPQYANSRFYIAGESYAGHYVPQLAALVLEQNKAASTKINLKGMMVGNAWTDTDIDNYGAIFYWWSHALISDATFKGISNECNFSAVGPLRTATDDKCTEYVDEASEQLGSINIYDIYVDVCVSSHAQAETRHFGKQLGRTHFGGVSTRPLLKDAYDPCVDDEVETYLNRPEVQVALHANVTGLPYRWTDCSDIVDYSNDDLLSSVLPTYHTLIESGLEILVFSGDVDAIVPVTGTREWLSQLPLKIKSEWRPWYVNSQVGGYVTVYDKLTFSTVRGAGHMVPYTEPARALHLFKSFVNKTPL